MLLNFHHAGEFCKNGSSCISMNELTATAVLTPFSKVQIRLQVFTPRKSADGTHCGGQVVWVLLWVWGWDERVFKTGGRAIAIEWLAGVLTENGKTNQKET